MVTPTRQRYQRQVWVLIVIPLALSCGPGQATWRGTVTDSAGVILVRNPESQISGPEDDWRVEEDLTIGSIDGDLEQQFGQIGGFDVDDEGRMYVLDRQAQVVRVFDEKGRFLRDIGRPGNGPGELGPAVAAVFAGAGGVISVVDLGNLRINRYDSIGHALGSVQIDATLGAPLRWSMDRRGNFLAQVRPFDTQQYDLLVRLGPGAAIEDTLVQLPRGQSVTGPPEARRITLFAPEPLWAAAASGDIYVALSNDFRILQHSPDGALRRIITQPFDQQRVADHERLALRRNFVRQLTDNGAPPPVVERLVAGFSIADYYPAFMQFLPGPQGSLLVQRVRPLSSVLEDGEANFDPHDLGANLWDVFDIDGRRLGVLEFPPRFTPFQVSGESVFGLWLDDLDVQYVKRLKLIGLG